MRAAAAATSIHASLSLCTTHFFERNNQPLDLTEITFQPNMNIEAKSVVWCMMFA